MNALEKQLVTFPNTPSTFSMTRPAFLRACFACGAPNQRCDMAYTA